MQLTVNQLIVGSIPASGASLSECGAVWLAHLVWDQGVLGSNPSTPTNLYLGSVMAAYQSPKLLVGVRVPAGMPKFSFSMEAWQSPVYCNSLENCRVEMLREFESHRFRQVNRELREWLKRPVC